MYARIISYPKATAYLLHGGSDRYYEDKIYFTPVTDFFRDAIDLFFQWEKGAGELFIHLKFFEIYRGLKNVIE